jgi:hypothetical protein
MQENEVWILTVTVLKSSTSSDHDTDFASDLLANLNGSFNYCTYSSFTVTEVSKVRHLRRRKNALSKGLNKIK